MRGGATRELFTTDKNDWIGNTQSDESQQFDDTTTGGWTPVKEIYQKSKTGWGKLQNKTT